MVHYAWDHNIKNTTTCTCSKLLVQMQYQVNEIYIHSLNLTTFVVNLASCDVTDVSSQKRLKSRFLFFLYFKQV